jgi:hypothetical protein
MSWVSLIPYAIKAGQSLMGGQSDKKAGRATAALEISQSEQTAKQHSQARARGAECGDRRLRGLRSRCRPGITRRGGTSHRLRIRI